MTFSIFNSAIGWAFFESKFCAGGEQIADLSEHRGYLSMVTHVEFRHRRAAMALGDDVPPLQYRQHAVEQGASVPGRAAEDTAQGSWGTVLTAA